MFIFYAVPTELKRGDPHFFYKHIVPTGLKKTEVCPFVPKTLHTHPVNSGSGNYFIIDILRVAEKSSARNV